MLQIIAVVMTVNRKNMCKNRRSILTVNVVGNEVIQYMWPVEDFSSLYDIGDVISPTFDATSLDSTLLLTPVDILDSVNLLQPNTTTATQNGRQVNVMEDVD